MKNPLFGNGVNTPFDSFVGAYKDTVAANAMERFEWKPWGDGSSPDGFGNIVDNEDEIIIAKEVLEETGKKICSWLNANLDTFD